MVWLLGAESVTVNTAFVVPVFPSDVDVSATEAFGAVFTRVGMPTSVSTAISRGEILRRTPGGTLEAIKSESRSDPGRDAEFPRCEMLPNVSGTLPPYA